MKRITYAISMILVFSLLLISCSETYNAIDPDDTLIDITDINTQLQASQGRGKEKAKLEYSINEKKNRPSGEVLPFIMYAQNTDNTLIISFSGELREANLIIKDGSDSTILEELFILINKEKTISFSPAKDYPYSIEITSPDADVKGTISLVSESDEEY